MAKTYRRKYIKKHHWDSAQYRVNNSPVYKLSHRKEEANEVGFIGEIIFEEFLNDNGVIYSDERSSTKHDYIINGKYSLDLKTKDRTVIPMIHYDNSVPLYNHEHQRPDYYYFISLFRDKNDKTKDITRFKEAYILGGIGIQELEKVGIKWEAGEVDQRNGTKFWTACINVDMAQLTNNHSMLKIFK